MQTFMYNCGFGDQSQGFLHAKFILNRDRSGTWSYRWLGSHPVWMLGTELQSSAREVCALNGWAVFLSPLACYRLQENKSLSQSGSGISR